MQIPFSTSGTELPYYRREVSQLSNKMPNHLSNLWKSERLRKVMALALENWTKSAIKFSMKVPITWFHELVSNYFVKEYLRKQNSLFNLVQTLWSLNFLKMLVSLELFILWKLIFKETAMWKIATFGIFHVLFCTFRSGTNMAQITHEKEVRQYLWKNSMFFFQGKNIFGVFILSLK